MTDTALLQAKLAAISMRVQELERVNRDSAALLERVAALEKAVEKRRYPPSKYAITRRINPQCLAVVVTIRDEVCEHYKLSAELLNCRERPQWLADIRHTLAYLCRELTEFSSIDIGKALGNRDHGTILHSCKQVKMRLEREPEYAEELQVLRGNCVAAIEATCAPVLVAA